MALFGSKGRRSAVFNLDVNLHTLLISQFPILYQHQILCGPFPQDASEQLREETVAFPHPSVGLSGLRRVSYLFLYPAASLRPGLSNCLVKQ